MALVLTLLALSPIILVIILIAIFNWPASKAMPVSAIYTLLLAKFYWGMHADWMSASVISGALTAIDILLIVLGALLLIGIMKKSKKIDVIIADLKSITPDSRIQMIIIGFAFVSFLEGIAGFGTATAIAAPLLVVLGFPAVAAVSLPLILDAIPVTFGAVGVPINYGIPIAVEGLTPEVLRQISLQSALLHSSAAIFLPLLVCGILTRFFSDKKSWKLGFGVWKFALIVSIAFIIPYVAISWYLGPELPSIVGSLVALFTGVILAKKKIAMPKKVWAFKHDNHHPKITLKKNLVAWSPYILVSVLLITTRFQGPIQDWFRSITINYNGILGTTLNYSLPVLFNPGTIFIIVSLIAAIYFKMKFKDIGSTITNVLKKLVPVSIALIFTIIIVRLLLNSNYNASGLESMLLIPAQALAATLGVSWFFFAPFIGSLGAFISGSNTVSNILFAGFQYNIAQNLGLGTTFVLALQAVGGGIGNMICVHNIVAACSTVGITGQEGSIFRATIIPSLIYAAYIGIIALIVVFFFL